MELVIDKAIKLGENERIALDSMRSHVLRLQSFPSVFFLSNSVPEDEAIRYLLDLPSFVSAPFSNEYGEPVINTQDLVPTDRINFFRRILQLFKGFSYTGSYERDEYSAIPVVELHCPAIDDCTATYEFSGEDKIESTVGVNLFCAKFLGGSKVTLSLKDTVSAKGQCVQIGKRFRFIVHEWKRKGEKHHTFEIKESNEGIDLLPFTPIQDHFCTTKFDVIRNIINKLKVDQAHKEHDMLDIEMGRAFVEKEIRVRKGIMIKSTGMLGLPIDDLGVFAKLVSSVETEFAYKYKLVSGFKYFGFYRTNESSCYSWAWKGKPKS